MPAFELFADSFSGYKQGSFSDTDLLANFRSRWTNTAGNSSIIPNGRNGPGLLLSNSVVNKTLQNHSQDFTVGFAFRPDSVGASNNVIFQLQNNDAVLFALFCNTDGTLSVKGGNATLGVSSRALHQGLFYWIDLTVSFGGGSPVTMDVEVRINSNVEISCSGSCQVNASDLLSGDATANNFRLSPTQGTGGSSSATFSHFYIKNTLGYYGDVSFFTLVPNGDVVSDWTTESGSVHYVMVNTVPVDLTQYLKDDTVGHQDIWDWQDCPGFSGTLQAINIRVLAKKDDEGAKSFKIVVGDTGIEAQSPEFFVSDISPEYYEYSLENDPATGMPWTQAGFNAKRFGIKLIS